jgi:hypothetical protein
LSYERTAIGEVGGNAGCTERTKGLRLGWKPAPAAGVAGWQLHYRASTNKNIDASTAIGWFKENAAFVGGLVAAFIAFLSFQQSKRTADANLKLSFENRRDERRFRRDTQFL